jgi:hypothetical protein
MAEAFGAETDSFVANLRLIFSDRPRVFGI